MQANIVFFNADSLPENLRQEISQQVRFIGGYLNTALLNEIKETADLVISRAYTAAYLRKNLNIPIVDLEISSFDIVRTMSKYAGQILKRNEKEIGLCVFHETNHDISAMEKLVGLKIRCYPYHHIKEIRHFITAAKEEGIKTFFGGLITQAQAQLQGIASYIISPNRETILQAIKNAKDILLVRERDQVINEQLKTIINLISDGIVSIGPMGNILFINATAQRILGLDEAVIGEKAEIAIPSKLASLLQSSAPIDGKFMNINQDNYLVSVTPIANTKTKKSGGLAVIHAVSSLQVLEQKIREELFSKGLVAKFKFGDITGQSPPLLHAIHMARRYADSDATVLITGESGTGKEMFAQSIHQASRRCNGPFVAINSASLPEHLLESELFGYEEGAFTGARKGGKPGFFELAHKGTLFLDEISETTLQIQTSLLRVLQNKQVIRIGGSQVIPVDVRVIAAVNKNLYDLVAQGNFRQDLYYRLNILGLNIPPLRERLTDIPQLAQRFLHRMSLLYNKEVWPLSDEVYLAFQSHKWPGNIRELENLIEKYAVICDATFTAQMAEELALNLLSEHNPDAFNPRKPTITVSISTLQEMEGNILLQLDQTINDKNKLAQLLGISRSTLWRKLQNISQRE